MFADLLTDLAGAGVDPAQVAWVDATHGELVLPAETQVIVHRADGRFAVGYVERGRLVPYEIVGSEAAACDLTYRLLTTVAPPARRQSSQVRAASREKGRRATARSLARLHEHQTQEEESQHGGCSDANERPR